MPVILFELWRFVSPGLTAEELVDAHGYRHAWEKPPSQPSYKAGPRDGVIDK
jgi:hypothetical protein